jgi:hypothetical protein
VAWPAVSIGCFRFCARACSPSPVIHATRTFSWTFFNFCKNLSLLIARSEWLRYCMIQGMIKVIQRSGMYRQYHSLINFDSSERPRCNEFALIVSSTTLIVVDSCSSSHWTPLGCIRDPSEPGSTGWRCPCVRNTTRILYSNTDT